MSKRISVSKALGEALREEMQRDDKDILIEEDMTKKKNINKKKKKLKKKN